LACNGRAAFVSVRTFHGQDCWNSWSSRARVLACAVYLEGVAGNISGQFGVYVRGAPAGVTNAGSIAGTIGVYAAGPHAQLPCVGGTCDGLRRLARFIER
jgi:hypothetical protein